MIGILRVCSRPLAPGFAWQFVPALRMVTSAPTGCLWGREASKSRRALAEMCAVAMGPAGPGLTVARANLVRLVRGAHVLWGSINELDLFWMEYFDSNIEVVGLIFNDCRTSLGCFASLTLRRV